MLIVGLLLKGLLFVASAGEAPLKLNDANDNEAPLVLQKLNYTENPVDIPNPDRGFYRPEGYVVPVDGGTPGFPDLGAVISGTTVYVNSRIVYMEFDLRNFSSKCPPQWKTNRSLEC